MYVNYVLLCFSQGATILIYMGFKSSQVLKKSHIICDPPTRNESDCYLVTFWVQPFSQRGCHSIDFAISTKSGSPVFYKSENTLIHNIHKVLSVISKCLEQSNPSIKAI